MNIKIANEKKVYVAPSMDVLYMGDNLSLMCASNDPWCKDIEGTIDEYN